jgi:hypothetical protein
MFGFHNHKELIDEQNGYQLAFISLRRKELSV